VLEDDNTDEKESEGDEVVTRIWKVVVLVLVFWDCQWRMLEIEWWI
jgi:hypothetical protein